MTTGDAFERARMARNIALYPWFKFFQSLLFTQGIWFLFFQETLSAAEAILIYAAYDLATTLLEVPSGYLSDRVGRRLTLIAGAFAALVGSVLFLVGDTFVVFALAQGLLGVGAAFTSGTDSSILYESLDAEGRADEVEAQELRGWRFSFTAFAVSAALGGAMSLVSFELAFAATAVSAALWLGVVFSMAEPDRQSEDRKNEAVRLQHLKDAFRQPVLIWLFALSTLMYGFSHIPFVFGQPFILEALDGVGWSSEAPLVSGLVSSTMMLVSVAASWLVPSLKKRFGLAAMFLIAMGIQVGLVGVLALTNSVIAIAFLFLRMVPSSIHGPLLVARVQPELEDDSRATFLSIKSLVGRLLFASSLWVASSATSEIGLMSYPEMQLVLGAYFTVGAAALLLFALTARRAGIEAANNPATRDEKAG